MLTLFLALIVQTAPAPAPAAPQSPAQTCAAVRETLDYRINRAARISWQHRGAVQTLVRIEAHERTHGQWPAGAVAPRPGVDPAVADLTPEELTERLAACLERYPLPAD